MEDHRSKASLVASSNMHTAAKDNNIVGREVGPAGMARTKTREASAEAEVVRAVAEVTTVATVDATAETIIIWRRA